MFGIAGRRSALTRTKCLTTVLPARAALGAQHSYINSQDFHSTPTQADSRPTWMPMRVKTPWVDALTQARESQDSGAQKSAEKTVERDLSPKKMSDSYYSAILPLAQDKWLLDSYLNSSGHIRLGSLLMDLDALAGIVAYRHTGDGVSTVTAACDRITIENPLMEICDLELSGQCTYSTGRSSMEISLQVNKARPEGEEARPEDVLITCAFTMVSLDPATKKPVPVAPLIVETEEEKRLFQKGEEKYQAKKALRTRSLLEKAPDAEESNLIHSMWTKEMSYLKHKLPRPQNLAFMSDTVLKSAMIMQPQYRNRHNFMIFGGFLLKQTFELAFCCAASFAHARPNFVALDPSTFENPVPVGSVLYLRATVAYTEPEEREGDGTKYTKVQVRVDSKVRDVEHGTKKSTGMFNYTFLVEKDVHVMPKEYGEFMLWADARRRAQSAAAIDPAHNALRGMKDSVTE
ncbi:hypothetical protein N7461_008166 [Penicillium sp. DV-2018c]|nr:hypothetical protein N7461_008166 [Penicillium sp. DV-2018c]